MSEPNRTARGRIHVDVGHTAVTQSGQRHAGILASSDEHDAGCRPVGDSALGQIEREAQDKMAMASQMKAVAAQKAGHLAREITPVSIAQKKGDAVVVDTDEHPRETSLEKLASLKGVVRPDGTVTAGNASGVNDGTLLGLLQIDGWRMLAPVKHGDTIRVHATVVDKKESSKLDRGVVSFMRKCVKQDGSVVQEMKATLMYKRRPKS